MVLFWFALLAISMLLYLLLDGFDLGVGMLSGLTRDDARCRTMMAAVAPVWDGNETWLVSAGVILFGAFPLAYAAALSLFYVPVAVMLAGLILRGVAFEYRAKAQRSPALWDAAFALGSFAAAFAQGAMVGALVDLPANGAAGLGLSAWLSPFSVLSGLGLCVAYALAGAAWLVKKCDGDMRAYAYAQLTRLAALLLLVLLGVFGYALAEHLAILQRWLDRPWLFVCPVAGVIAALALVAGVRRHRDDLPFAMVAVIFVVSFATFAISFWPYVIPYSLTVAQAAAPESSLSFMFWGAGLFVFPLMLLYTAVSYRVFRGKVDLSAHHY